MENLNVTKEQEYIVAKHSRMIGRVLDLVEAAIPEGNQCDSFKKLVQVPLYDFRNDMLRLTVGEIDDSS
tara:strand:+ start:432 stop:638 length:207 start_codon:yes stop_codon:yes gene_type:complete